MLQASEYPAEIGDFLVAKTVRLVMWCKLL